MKVLLDLKLPFSHIVDRLLKGSVKGSFLCRQINSSLSLPHRQHSPSLCIPWDFTLICTRDSDPEGEVSSFPSECSILSHRESYYILLVEYLLFHAACLCTEDKKLPGCCLGLGSSRNFTFLLHLLFQLVTSGSCIHAIGHEFKKSTMKREQSVLSGFFTWPITPNVLVVCMPWK